MQTVWDGLDTHRKKIKLQLDRKVSVIIVEN